MIICMLGKLNGLIKTIYHEACFGLVQFCSHTYIYRNTQPIVFHDFVVEKDNAITV